MNVWRRNFGVLAMVAVLGAAALGTASLQENAPPKDDKKMHGMIGKMTAVEGKRDALIAILLAGTKDMPGCMSYVVARDPADATAIWITEVWDSPASHKASLALPAVQDAIQKGKPWIARFDQSIVTEPVGGHGLHAGKGR